MVHQHHQKTSPQSAPLCQESWSMVIFSIERKKIWQASSHSIFVNRIQVVSGFQASWMRSRSCDHSHHFLEQVEVQVSSCQLTSFTKKVSIFDRFVSETLSFIIRHRTARLNERIHALMKQYHPHLLSVSFSQRQDQRWNSSTTSRRHGQTVIFVEATLHFASPRRS